MAYPVWLDNPVHVITDLTTDYIYLPFSNPDVILPFSIYKNNMDLRMKIKSIESCTIDNSILTND